MIKKDYSLLIDVVIKNYKEEKVKEYEAKKNWVEMVEYGIKLYKETETYKSRVKKRIKKEFANL